jgi:FkbH-like protein
LNLDDLSISELIRKRRSLRRELSAREGLRPLRIAVLGGSTTNELVDLWELYLLHEGFAPVFHQSEYGQFYEEAVLHTDALKAFAPDLVYVHTSYRNVLSTPAISATEEDLEVAVQAELGRYRQVWDSIDRTIGCQVIQNNFELPPVKTLGSLDAVVPGGAVRFYLALNLAFGKEAAARSALTLHDVMSLSAEVGGRQWFDPERWFSYKLLLTVEAHAAMVRSLTALVRGLYGRSRKVLVLDLDNTVWGGVIGDDGVDRIHIGKETPMAEAFTEFQSYCAQLRNRGVLLAVCSKNNDEIARSGFAHPDSVLKIEDFSAFRANWDPKHENILSIAKELNLGVDSLVFADDNPAERAIVSGQVPGVAVPEMGDNPAFYPGILQAARYFETVSISKDDLARAEQYAGNARRATAQAAFADYGEYLDSLQMTAEIARFVPVYLERITQLTNKTNQFNLTTRRYTLAEMEAATRDPGYIGLYGRLTDRFGDNGLVSVVLGRREDDVLHLDLWLMSCRVLKRDMEIAMLDVLVAEAQQLGVRTLQGVYLPTKKNGMVADFYERIGFARLGDIADGGSSYRLDVPQYEPQNKHIQVHRGDAGINAIENMEVQQA